MPRRDVKLVPGEFYHIDKRGNNRGRIFLERQNYAFFVRRVRDQLVPVMDGIAYCLMPTHYPLLTQVKMGGEEGSVSNAMMRFSVSYTKAINAIQSSWFTIPVALPGQADHQQ